jgi:hypothetical protein
LRVALRNALANFGVSHPSLRGLHLAVCRATVDQVRPACNICVRSLRAELAPVYGHPDKRLTPKGRQINALRIKALMCAIG